MSSQNREVLGFVSSHPPKGRQAAFNYLQDAFFKFYLLERQQWEEKEVKMLLSQYPSYSVDCHRCLCCSSHCKDRRERNESPVFIVLSYYNV